MSSILTVGRTPPGYETAYSYSKSIWRVALREQDFAKNKRLVSKVETKTPMEPTNVAETEKHQCY